MRLQRRMVMTTIGEAILQHALVLFLDLGIAVEVLSEEGLNPNSLVLNTIGIVTN